MAIADAAGLQWVPGSEETPADGKISNLFYFSTDLNLTLISKVLK